MMNSGRLGAETPRLITAVKLWLDSESKIFPECTWRSVATWTLHAFFFFSLANKRLKAWRLHFGMLPIRRLSYHDFFFLCLMSQNVICKSRTRLVLMCFNGSDLAFINCLWGFECKWNLDTCCNQAYTALWLCFNKLPLHSLKSVNVYNSGQISEVIYFSRSP